VRHSGSDGAFSGGDPASPSDTTRQAARDAWQRTQGGSTGAQTWLSELIWREFFHQILHHHPHVVGHAFRPEFDALRWDHGKLADAHFAAWCGGRTGYPLVDAAMHQLNQTGYMHNRLRMVCASFLCKHLGIDWRRGEAYFAEKLNDFELASNNGGWQWAASTGCDAQPYFRIFNPVTQSERFDPRGVFIRRYVPALAQLPDALIHAPWRARPLDLAGAHVTLGRDYPMPVVERPQTIGAAPLLARSRARMPDEDELPHTSRETTSRRARSCSYVKRFRASARSSHAVSSTSSSAVKSPDCGRMSQ